MKWKIGDRLFRNDLYFTFAWHFQILLRDAHFEHAIGEVCFDRIFVQIIRKRKLPNEGAMRALDTMERLESRSIGATRAWPLLFAAQRDHAIGERDLHIICFQTRQLSTKKGGLLRFRNIDARRE